MAVTRIQLHREHQTLTACALDEPCLVLIRNDAVFNLLIARRAAESEDMVLLHEVWWFSACIDSSRIRRLSLITLARERSGYWVARDAASGHVIRRPSVVPYHVVFISEHDLQSVLSSLDMADAGRIFSSAQQHFGQLAGFDFGPGVLISPKDYATVGDLTEHIYLAE